MSSNLYKTSTSLISGGKRGTSFFTARQHLYSGYMALLLASLIVQCCTKPTALSPQHQEQNAPVQSESSIGQENIVLDGKSSESRLLNAISPRQHNDAVLIQDGGDIIEISSVANSDDVRDKDVRNRDVKNNDVTNSQSDDAIKAAGDAAAEGSSGRRHRRSAIWWLSSAMRMCETHRRACKGIEVSEGSVRLQIQLVQEQ